MNSFLIAITCGDPSGIGPEVITNWLNAKHESTKKYCFIGPQSWLDTLSVEHKIPVGHSQYQITPGKPSLEGAEIAFEALNVAAKGCMDKRFNGVVTGPVNKYNMQKAGFYYPGQTEFFADIWGGDPVMAFAGRKLRVVLATWHIPFIKVKDFLTKKAIKKSIIGAEYLCKALRIDNPKIGVCGLNPHAGEGGLLGDEERNWINPFLKDLQLGIGGLHDRALPADTIFWRHARGDFDAVVALYHDQGLAPTKLIDFDTSVNITLGLPFIRTSPDHGTAYSIAGKNIASNKSFDNAVKLIKKLRH